MKVLVVDDEVKNAELTAAELRDAGFEAEFVNGGAVALGHPLGASGARIMTTLVHELERRGARFALQTICCAGGLATATIVERVD